MTTAPIRAHLRSVLVATSALAIGALAALAPMQSAHASVTPTLSLSATNDLTPGQAITATVSDPSGVLCDQSFGMGEWNVYLAWYRTGLATPVGYSAPQSAQSNAFVHGSSMNITTNFFVVWLDHDPAQKDSSTWDGTYTVIAGCMTAALGTGDVVNGDGTNHTGTASTDVSTTYVPVTVNRIEVVRGESFDITVADSSQWWCDFSTGSGFSMGAWFTSELGGAPDFTVPGDLPNGHVPGVGSFTWDNTNTTVTVTVPSDATSGNYLLGVTCISPAPEYIAGTRAAVYGYITITNPPPGPTPDPTPPNPLPNTGYDTSTFAAVATAALLSAGVGLGMRIHFIRRRNRV